MTNLPETIAWSPQMAALVKTKYNDVFQTIHEFQAFRYTCERAGLDPVVPEIWPVRYGGKNPKIVYQTSIEGYIKMAIKSTGKQKISVVEIKGGLTANCLKRDLPSLRAFFSLK